jgi:tRNA pseudouridine55 synthase
VSVVCSTGTYVRALARDLGSALGVGGHLTSLRRTRVGPFGVDAARTLDELEAALDVVPLDDVARMVFDCRDLDDDQARVVSHGGPLPWAEVPPRAPGWAPVEGTVPLAFFGPDGTFLALAEQRDGAARPLAVFV